MLVPELLAQAGLSHLLPGLQHMTLNCFKALLIQDYDKHGVVEMADKQAVFKLIQDLNAEDLSALTLSPEPSSGMSSQSMSSPEPYEKYRPGPAGEDGAGRELLDDFDDGEELLDLEADDDGDFLGEQADAAAFSEAFMRSATLTPVKAASAYASAAASALSAAPSSSHLHPSALAAPAGPAVPGQPAPGEVQTAGPGGMQSSAAQEAAAALASVPDPPKIRVIVRKRPLNRKEVEKGDNDVLECDAAEATLYVHEPKVKVDLTRFTECHAFGFDDVFDEHVDNDALYARAIKPLIATVFRAGKGTCFAYGQTGSGKTFTMAPLPVRAAADIFAVMDAIPEFGSHSLHVACYEIYGGKVFDLLNGRQRLDVREDAKRRVQVVGLKEVEVRNVELLGKLCEHAACARSTGSTGANDESSRSHSIMTFAVRAPAPAPADGRRPSRPGAPPQAAPALRTVGKLSFIDLAGSERGADTYENDKQTRLEGAEINKSLLALKECIRALDAEARHIPFRGSKLTEVLRDSFIGKNARTVMIANVSPNSTSCEHTLNTLRYADRVKEIKKEGSRAGGLAARPEPPSDGAEPAAASVPPAEAAGGAAQRGGASARFSAAPSPPAAPLQRSNGAAPSRPQRPDGASNGRLSFAGGSANAAATTPFVVGAMAGGAATTTTTTTAAAARGTATSGSRSPRKVNPPPPPPPLPRQRSTPARTPTRVAKPPPLQHHRQQQQQQQQVAAPTIVPAATAAAAVPAAPRRQGGSLAAHPLSTSFSDGSLSSRSAPSTSQPAAGALGRSERGSGAFSAASADDVDVALNSLLQAEEELIEAHRKHIENTMAVVREEMELLAQLDSVQGPADIASYVDELSHILVDKAAAVSQLQQHLGAFRRKLKAAGELAAAGGVGQK